MISLGGNKKTILVELSTPQQKETQLVTHVAPYAPQKRVNLQQTQNSSLRMSIFYLFFLVQIGRFSTPSGGDLGTRTGRVPQKTTWQVGKEQLDGKKTTSI